MASGMTYEEIIEDHPELEKKDFFAALEFAKLSIIGTSTHEIA